MSLKRHLSVSLFIVVASIGARAQDAGRTSPPRVPETTAGPTSGPLSGPASLNDLARTPAPQVVTVIHRLSGIKLLRLLRHSEAQASGVNALDDGFAATKDLHTSFIAGLMLGDGRTIVSWMPQAEAEVETPVWPPGLTIPSKPSLPASVPGVAQLPPPEITGPVIAPAQVQLTDPADLMIVRRDGQRLSARYVGLDGLTGLSLLQVSGEMPPAAREALEAGLFVGQRVRLLAPQRAAEQGQPQTNGTIYLRVGEIQGRLTEIKRVSSGRIARLTVRAANLSPAIAGGIVLNEAGETIGIVETSDVNEARIMPAALVRRAAERVLARRASVPRPWLGVRGDEVSALSLDSFKAMGWQPVRATSLLNRREGILLTSVAQGTPAALANLHPGDLILRVNDALVKSADDFTFMLNEAGGGTSVKFTLLQPGQLVPRAVNITLSEALNPIRAMDMSETSAAMQLRLDPLFAHGAETWTLSPQAAARFGAGGGLLVVFVKPESPAASSGLRTGDVIEAVDGQIINAAGSFVFPAQHGATRTLGIVRNRQKLSIKLQSENGNPQK
jgi:S1-C subfamily serine protease